MKEILTHLLEQKTLDKPTAKKVLTDITQGKINNSQIACFLTIYMMRSITVEELEGFRDAMLDLCLAVDLSQFNPIDVCGTGGDGKDTFNISTTSSFILAGAGVNVAKHGNYGVSSPCGSSNVMEYFGYKFTNDKDSLKRQMEKAGICIMHAPLFHPAMKNVGPVRKELAVKTFFNMLGPMVNPAFPDNQLVGVFSLELARLYGYLYQKSDKNFMILHSLDVYDEISLTSPFKVISNDLEKVMEPEEIGFKKVQATDLRGGVDIPGSGKILLDILQNKGTEAQNSAVTANAAMGIKCVMPEKSFEEAVGMAKDSLKSGRAYTSFKTLMETE
jgi:anthranilate phosphoribosyltransferase